MSAPIFTVETRAQGCLVISPDSVLADGMVQALHSSALDPMLLPPSARADDPSLLTYLTTHDLDYVLYLSTPSESLLQFLEGQGSGVILSVNHAVNSATRQVELGEYVAPGGCPTLDQLLTEAAGQGTITLPEGGLVDYRLLSPGSLCRALAQLLLLPTFPSHALTLTNPTSLSLHALAHQVASLLPRPTKLVFTETDGLQPSTPPSADLAGQGIVLDGDFSADLAAYVKNFTATSKPNLPLSKPTPIRQAISPPTHSPAPEDPPPTPIKPKPRLSHLEFVPSHRSPGLSRLRSLLPTAKSRGLAPRLAIPRPPRGLRIVLHGLAIAAGLYFGSLAFAATITGLHIRTLTRAQSSSSLPSLSVSPLLLTSSTYLQANLVAVSSLPVISQNGSLRDLNLLFDSYRQILLVMQDAQALVSTASEISRYVLGEGTSDIAVALSRARLQTEDLYQKVSLLDGTLPPDPPQIIDSAAGSYHSLKSGLVAAKKSLLTSKAVLASAPEFLALGKRAKYAVLFQNNMELRGSGGFIGSFAILSFENGRLYDMPIYDVYQADGQLKGHVEPPAPIKDILGEANWFLRDSNFDPDFPTSARRAEWFLKKTLNLDVDGTLAITVDTLRSLLYATGPLTLTDYQETVSEGNIYERAQFHAEVNFFPGSTAKKEYLSSVADAVIAALREPERVDQLELAGSLFASLSSKNIQLSFLSPALERVMGTLNWNGAIQDAPCPGGAYCLKDYTLLVDSNFGVNKANYYVTRDLAQTVEITKDGAVDHTFEVKYSNTATSTAWPAGPYKNYARLYLPEGSQLNSLTVGDQLMTSKDYTVTRDHGKMVIGFLLTVPVNSDLAVKVVYRSGTTLTPGSLYTWYWQKQAGTPTTEPLTVTVNYPLFLKPSVISPAPESSPQQLKFNLTNDSDRRITIKF